MKKNIFLLGLIGLLILVGYSTSSCSSKEHSETGPVAYLSLLPETLDFLIKISSVDTVYDHFSVTPETVFGRSVEDLAEIRRKWGFNPLDAEALRKQGFDTTRELVFAMDNIRFQEGDEDPVFTGLILLPVTDAAKASEALKRYLKNSHPEMGFNEKDAVTYFEAADPRMHGGIMERDGYLLMTAESEGDIGAYTASLMTAKTGLQDKNAFKNVIAKVDPEEEIFVYADINGIVGANMETFRRLSREAAGEKGPDLLQNLNYLKDYLGAGFSIDLDQSDLLVKGLLEIAPDSDALKVMTDVRYNKQTLLGVPENPAILFSTAVNVPEYYRIMRKAMAPEERQEWEARLAGIRENLGVDLEKEVIPNIAGNLNIGIYDGVGINMTNYNALVTLSIKDEAKMKSVLEQAYARLTPEQRSMIGTTVVGETDAYVLTLFGAFQFYIGVKEHNLILSVGKPMFEKAVYGGMDSGFLSRMSDPELIRTLKGEGGIFYLNVQEVYQALKNFLFLVRQFNIQESITADSENALRRFEHLLLSSQVEGAAMRGEMEIETRFEQPFFKGLYELSKKIEAAAAAEKTETPPPPVE
ncbi:MAG: hypothetical protein ACLFQY_12845 [Desulfococcaceae bacterium]